MRSRSVLSVSLVALVGVAAACGGGGSVATKHKKVVVASTTSTTAGPPTQPFTGLPDPTGQANQRPAMAVKIENLTEARPQTGLDVADIVYEEITEGGITRFIALYNSTIPPIVGPVRSVRLMDPDVVTPIGGIFVYSGGIQPTVAALGQAPVNAIVDTGADPALFRVSSRPAVGGAVFAPHNLYGHGDQLLARGGKPIPPTALFSYLQQGVPFNGDAVQSFSVNFTSTSGNFAPTYTWDPASGTWKRAIGLVPFTDTDNKVQIAPQNVVVQFVQCCLNSPEGGAYNTVGNGDAWIFSGGKVVKGKWARSATNQVTQFTDAAGQPIKLAPGRTWIEFTPWIFELSNGVPITYQPGTTPSTAPPTTLPAPTTTTTKKKK